MTIAMTLQSVQFVYGASSDTTSDINAAEWCASSAANESSLLVAREILPAARERKGTAIPGSRWSDIDYTLRVVESDVATRCEIYRSDGVLISTFTIAPAGSPLTSDEIVFTPPCCLVQRAPGELLAHDTSEWLARFEQAVAIAVLERVGADG